MYIALSTPADIRLVWNVRIQLGIELYSHFNQAVISCGSKHAGISRIP